MKIAQSPLRVLPTFEDGDETNPIMDPKSSYNPDEKTRKRIKEVQEDFAVADLVRRRTYSEFNWAGNDESLIDYTREMQVRFNSTPPSRTNDPDNDWKSNHVNPDTRNKVISIVAAVTSSIMRPKVVAQNSDSEEDAASARVMEDLRKYVDYQTDYDDKFLSIVQEMCVSPGVIVHQGYSKVKRMIKDYDPSTESFTEKEEIDPILSGFQMDIVPIDELYISNAFEPDIQKQDFFVWRKAMTWNQAYMEAQDKEGFNEYVHQGNRLYFNYENDTFFEQFDDFLDGRLVFRDIYYNRRKDLQLTFYNGWLDGNPEAKYHRADTPILRLDKKYPFAMTGYERYNSRFFYRMPLVAKMALIQDEIDILHRAITDGTLLSIFPPLNMIGAEAEEVASIKPSAMNAFSRPDTKVEPMNLGQNLSSGYALLADQKRSMDMSSQSPRAAGFSEKGEQTLGEVQMLQQNTDTQMTLIMKMVAKIVRDYGNLTISSIVQHMTVGEVLDLTSDLPTLKYNTILIPDVERFGDKKTTVVEFTTEMPKNQLEEEEMSLKIMMLNRKRKQTIYKVNPNTFRKLSFSQIVEPTLEDKQASFTKRIFAFDRMKDSELIDQDANYKYNLIEPLYPGESSRFLKDKDKVQMDKQMAAAQGKPVGRPANPPQAPMSVPQMYNQ